MTGAEPRANLTGIAFGALLAILAAYHQFKLPPVLPLLTSQYNHDPRIAGGFMSVYALAGLVLSPILGGLIERHGMPRFLYGAFLLFAAGGVLALLRPDWGAGMLASRTLEGTGFAVLAIVAPVLIIANAGQRYVALAIGLAATWIPTGQLLANAAARPILSAGTWQMLWWIGLIATAAMAAWTALRTAKSPVSRPGGEPRGSGAADMPARNRPLLWLAAALFCLWSTQYIAYMTWLPSYLVSAHGFDPDDAALIYTVPIVTLLAFNLLTGWAMTRGLRVGPLLTVALAGQAIVWALMPWTGTGWTGLMSLVFYGIGAGVAPTCLFALPNAIEGGGRPGAFATLMTGRNLGVLIGPLLLGLLVSATTDWTTAGPVFAAVTGFAVVLAAWMTVILERRKAAAVA